jgi:LAO/AO transport system kinase
VRAAAAADGAGIGELWNDIERHRAWLTSSGTLAADREAAVVQEVRALAGERLATSVAAQLAADGGLRAKLRDRAMDPYAAADDLIRRLAPG